MDSEVICQEKLVMQTDAIAGKNASQEEVSKVGCSLKR